MPVGYVAQPFADVGIDGLYVQHNVQLLHLTGQRHIEFTLQITMEAFYLALGARPIALTQTDPSEVSSAFVPQKANCTEKWFSFTLRGSVFNRR